MSKNPDAADLELERQIDLAFEGADLEDEDEDEDGDSLALLAASAALALGAAREVEPMPASLKSRLEADAVRFQAPPAIRPRPSKLWKAAACAGWLAAAASWLAMAALLRPPPRPTQNQAENLAMTWSSPLKPTDHPLAKGSGGEVAWDQTRQTGTLRIQGLAGVDPAKAVYQLWIFDEKRDPRYPVDGGTFTVADASTRTVVPVRAGLPVGQPTLFAVTLERPGGVVVSDRQRIMLTATYP